MITATQKKTAEAIINVFETSSVLGAYGQVTLIAGDSGHLTFGRSQTTLGSGNLAKLIERYCNNAGARFGAALRPFLSRLTARDVSLDGESHLHNILRASADDPVMRETQDAFFDEVYWKAAERIATRCGIETPLGMAVVYDSTVHGAWERISDRTTTAAGELATIGERTWVTAYVQQRRNWLRDHSREDLRPTVYRMDAMQRLIELQEWGLELPLVVRGFEISTASLHATPADCFDAPLPGSRPLALQTPLARGLDVRLLQLGLSKQGAAIKADGVFGRGSAGHLKTYQLGRGLTGTGMADAALITQLLA